MIEDIFIPKSSANDALVQQLHTVTYVTTDKETLERAFIQGYGLTHSGWKSPPLSERTIYNKYFGFTGNDWEISTFYKSGEGANIQIRVIYNPENTTIVRQNCDGLIVGGATISFPKEDLRAHEDIMTDIGFTSTMGVKEMEFQAPTGEVYTSAEIIYFAPENAYLLAVKRPDTFVPVGPIDKATGIGGPAYSARCIADADSIIHFFETVMGYEIRRDVIFPIGDISAMLLPKGSQERFIQAFAPGSNTGYLVLMDHLQDNIASTAPVIGTPSRGITMWSFKTDDIEEVYRRAQSAGTTILHGLSTFNSPCLESSRTLLMKDPGGFYIEIFEDG